MGYLCILGAIPGFFLGAWLLMLLWDMLSPKPGAPTLAYVAPYLSIPSCGSPLPHLLRSAANADNPL